MASCSVAGALRVRRAIEATPTQAGHAEATRDTGVAGSEDGRATPGAQAHVHASCQGFGSKREATRLIRNGGIYVNNERVSKENGD